MTRHELDNLAAFLRTRLGAPTGQLAPTTATRCRRTVEQAVLGLQAYLQLAAHHPAPCDLNEETHRAHALWQTLLDMAALWPDHPDNPQPPSTPTNPGPPPAVTTT